MTKSEQFQFTIEAGKTERHYWMDLWRYRELFYILAWRDITVRYKQTVIGILWAVLKPILTMVIFVIVFGKIAKLPSEGVPYPIFVFAALGTGLFVASLNVKYRDFRFVIPFIVQLGLYISPVGFSATIIPEQYRLLYYLNPMVELIDGFRWAISGGKTAFNSTELSISVIVVTLLCITGVILFRKTEKTFADVI